MNTLEREIEFRGKAKNRENTWFFGDLRVSKGKCWIFPRDEEPAIDKHRVIPKTVGQFTGLTDRKGNKIYEGDIVRRQRRGFIGNALKDEYDFGVVYYDDDVGAFGYREFPLDYLQIFDKIGTEDIEVIANYHDNPELTKWKFKKTGKNSGSYVPPQKLLEL